MKNRKVIEMRRFFILFIIGCAVFCHSCEEIANNELFFDNNIVSIEYGTSFGECLGYCRNSIKITETEIGFTSSGWTANGPLTEISNKLSLTKEEWDRLLEKINFIAFRNLDEVIGCPDCADGGAEWIKIVTTNISHEVTFEFHNEPEEVKDFINDLRNYIKRFTE